MTRVQRQPERRELSRRLLFAEDALRGVTYLQCAFTGDGTSDETAFRPVVADHVRRWESRGDLREPSGKDAALLGDSMVVVVAEEDLPATLPHGVTRLSPDLGELGDPTFLAELKTAQQASDHTMQRLLWRDGLDLGWLDRLAAPHASSATGLRSYAHTYVYATEDFAASDDPWAGPDVGWTAGASDGAIAYSDAREALYNKANSSGVSKFSYLAFDAGDLSGVTADYSVEGVVTQSDDYAVWYIAGRYINSGADFYAARALAGELRLYKWISGSPTQIGSYATAQVNATIRLEMVGTTLKVYFDGIERISTSDSSLSGAGSAALRSLVFNGAATDIISVSDYQVLIETPGGLPMELFQSMQGAL